MAKRICSVVGCDNPSESRGWCSKHYQRWKRNGDPTVTVRPGIDGYPLDLLLRMAAKGDGCWLWQGFVDAKGYGRIAGKFAHRLVYERAVGAIPEGLVLDHLCRVRHCVNPAHLEPVTDAVNIRRGIVARRHLL